MEGRLLDFRALAKPLRLSRIKSEGGRANTPGVSEVHELEGSLTMNENLQLGFARLRRIKKFLQEKERFRNIAIELDVHARTDPTTELISSFRCLLRRLGFFVNPNRGLDIWPLSTFDFFLNNVILIKIGLWKENDKFRALNSWTEFMSLYNCRLEENVYQVHVTHLPHAH